MKKLVWWAVWPTMEFITLMGVLYYGIFDHQPTVWALGAVGTVIWSALIRSKP